MCMRRFGNSAGVMLEGLNVWDGHDSTDERRSSVKELRREEVYLSVFDLSSDCSRIGRRGTVGKGLGETVLERE